MEQIETMNLNELERFIMLVTQFQKARQALGKPLSGQDAFERLLHFMYGEGAYLAVVIPGGSLNS